ncbi:MAG: hypothetical protein LBQ80_02800 [Clostridium sp.]|jgi:nicotinate phosphoribosyltransferase|nr:hypothetical protein [Clostridium sp.]
MSDKAQRALFEVYFRRNPRGGGFTVLGGIDEALQLFEEYGIDCDAWAVKSGTPVFPGEPVFAVEGKPDELLPVVHGVLCRLRTASAVMTVQARLKLAAGNARVAMPQSEETRRCFDASVFVRCWAGEEQAFAALCAKYKNGCVLPVDTYSTLKKGVPAAIAALAANAPNSAALYISSGDIAYQAIHARRMLDEAGLENCAIYAGGQLDEFVIRDIMRQGAPIDLFCVDRLPACNEFIASLAVSQAQGKPRMTYSQNTAKITPPGKKQLWRLLSSDGKALADVLAREDEVLPNGEEYTLFDPHQTWKRKEVTGYTAVPLLCKVVPGESEQGSSEEGLDCLWDEVLRFENPHKYYVDYSRPLWDLFRECMDAG